MDLQNLYLTPIFSLFIFFLMAYKIITKIYVPTQNLPPGPMKLPIIGNMHNLIGSLPHHQLRDLSKKYGPLMHLKLGEVSTIVISSPEFAREVLKTHDLNFASRPHVLASKIMGYDSLDIAFAPYGDYWRQLRKICTMELLSSKRVQSFQPIRGKELNNFIKRIASNEGSPINFTKEVLSVIFSITSRTALGRKSKGHEDLIEVVKEATEVAGGFELGDLYPSIKWLQYVSGLKPKLEKLHNQADNIMQNIINAHKEANLISSTEITEEDEVQEDLVDVLLKQEFGLSDDSVKALTWDIFGGGSDTSSATITWAMAEMIKNPKIMKKAQEEVRRTFSKEGKPNESGIENLKYLKSIVKETLRLHPPSPLLLPRECAQDCEIKGYYIPKKSKVIINAWAIGRDPNHWIDAERFYPERFIENSIDYKSNDFEFIPFGAGRRMCPGLTFGLINVEFALALLIYHFDWKLPNEMKNEDLDMSELFGITVSRKNDLYLIPIPFHP